MTDQRQFQQAFGASLNLQSDEISYNDVKNIIFFFFLWEKKRKTDEGILLGEPLETLERDLDEAYCEIKSCKEENTEKQEF